MHFLTVSLEYLELRDNDFFLQIILSASLYHNVYLMFNKEYYYCLFDFITLDCGARKLTGEDHRDKTRVQGAYSQHVNYEWLQKARAFVIEKNTAYCYEAL